VLFIRHHAFGDVLLTTPFFKMLYKQNPAIRIDLYSKWGEVYSPSAGFGKWISMDRIPIANVLKNDYSNIYWFNYEFDRSLHILDGYAFSTGLSLKDKTLSWTVLPDELTRAKILLKDVKRPLVGFLPVCGNIIKNLSSEKMQQIIDAVRKRLGMTVAVFADRPLKVCGCLNFSNRFASIRDLAAVISLCDVWLTIDTGPFHLAQALGVPTVGLFGCTFPELLATHPSQLQAVYVKSLPCLGCYHRVPRGNKTAPLCAQGDHACMRMLSESDVVQAIVQSLEHREDVSLKHRIEMYEAYRSSYLAQSNKEKHDVITMYQKDIHRCNLEINLIRRMCISIKEYITLLSTA
jgi:ADP-heptose:LPS heptosyltransferase